MPDLATAIILSGPGQTKLTVARSTAAGTPEFRIFTVPAGVTAEISGLTLADGRITGEFGGGIFNAGTLTVTNSTLSGNVSTPSLIPSGGQLLPFAGMGGGIYNSGTLTAIDSTLRGNSALEGGGIDNDFSGTMTVTSTTFDRNGSQAGGGGILNLGIGSLVNSTFSGNVTSGVGGAIRNSATLAVADSTLSGNSAFTGSGVYTVFGVLRVTSSILANDGDNLVGSFTSGGHNLFSDAPAEDHDATDLISTDPLLGPLADNGGLTFTYALLPGSPAIDAGSLVAGLTTDQRGIARPQGAAPDIGAYESRGFRLAVGGGSGQSTLVGSPFAAPLVVSVASPFGEPVTGGVVAFSAPTNGASTAPSRFTAIVGANGVAQSNASANGVTGTFTVAVRAAGADSVALSLTNTATSTVASTVDWLRRTGFHFQPTRLQLAFSAPLDRATAANTNNYQIVDLGPDGRIGTRDDRVVKVRSAAYAASAQTVTLKPAHRLSFFRHYLVTVRATAPGGLTDAAGNLLDGNRDGRAGGDYQVIIKGFATMDVPFSQVASASPSSQGRRSR